ncbi:DUF6325 family protein [Actinoplanes sp. NPDC049668]|uniref:DUF6325 family protein n=1 Tax=unclassified Actinoplanes TaxID=2626549 RepID=UPI0033B78ABA
MSGPVQVLVLGFPEASLSGEILAELNRLAEAGVVRLLDVLLVSRTADGRLDTLPPPPGAAPDLGRLTTAFLSEAETEAASDGHRVGQGGTDPATWSLEDAVPPGGAAAVALIEHLWAQPFVHAVRRAGGRLLDETWLAPDDRELLDRLAGEAR